jgi:transposase InsO family protein
LAGISRQAYHKGRHERARKFCDEEQLVAAVRRLRFDQPRLGTRKLVYLLRQEGIDIGRDRLFRILGARDMLVEPKRKAARTTYYDRSLPVYRNLLYQLEPTMPHHVWVSDITFVSTDEGFLYLSLITDMVSRLIVGWNAGETLEASECIKALQMALKDLPANRWPIHHSDRGCQYCCHEYVACLDARGLPVSMTEANHCYENAQAERVNGILKDEFNLDVHFRTRAQANIAIMQAIQTYNTRRPHLALAMRTPIQAHQLAA